MNQTSGTRPEAAAWRAIVARYQRSSSWRAGWQLVNTLGPYLLLWWLMYLCQQVSWWLPLPIAFLAGVMLVRLFVIFHDCGHGSFFASRTANHLCGAVCGLLMFTPYHHWRWQHGVHHGTAGNLDQRGEGDIWTLTVQEYLEAGRWKRFSYRLARNPFVLFVMAPLYIFVIHQRFPSAKASHRERESVWWTNLAILGMAVGLSAVFGVIPYFIFQLIALSVAGSIGVWLFYVQHQFEGVYWARDEDWDYATVALKGSSFYKLPRLLQWVTGNIGFHHIHHLSPRIPNYHLERCYKSDPIFQAAKPVTLLASLKTASFRLWDESTQRLVGWRQLRQQGTRG